MPEAIPPMATISPDNQCRSGGSRFQPARQTPRKIASVKNAKPSRENGIPIMAPAFSMNFGPQQSQLEGQDGARDRADCEENGRAARPTFRELEINRPPVRRSNPSAIVINTGIPIPTAAKIM
jgi:hypothetical protein